MGEALQSFPEWFSLPLSSWVNSLVRSLQANAGWVFDALYAALGAVLTPIQAFLTWAPWILVVVLAGAAGWAVRGPRMALAVAAALLFVGSLGLWDLSMITLALVLTATVTCVSLGVPIGIAMALSSVVNRALRPVLDLMQTMPSLVYLVPVVMLMGIGAIPGLIAVIIYAIPPVIRLTTLGIRNVPAETVEAGIAFGATQSQLLRKVQLPLGFPTLMAGVNQTIMMALAMVVLAALIDAGGLGGEVVTALARLDTGRGFSAGIAIVVLAIIIDRLSEGAADVIGRRRPRGASGKASGETGAAAVSGAGHRQDTGTRRPGRDDAAVPPPASGPPAITLTSVSKIFGPHPKQAKRLREDGRSKDEILDQTRSTIAVDDVSLEIAPGELFVIMGLSGSGKSTLVRCLNRLIEPTGGKVEIAGRDVRQLDRADLVELRRTKIGMVFQRFALLPHRSVADNVTLGLELRGAPREERRAAGLRALDVVGLASWADSGPEELSGGMQQRVGLARALATNPDILLMDEPFSALDPLMRRQLQEELATLQSDLRKTIVFITHDLDEALRLGDRVAIMKDGAVVQVGTPDEIVLHPADDYVEAFVEGHDRSEVLTARDVMFLPQSRLREQATPEVALRTMEGAGVSSAYVLDASGRLRGIVTADDAVAAAKAGVSSVSEIISSDVATTGPHEPLRGLIDLAASERYPIAVLDDDRRLLGVVARVSLLRGLASDVDSFDDLPSAAPALSS